MGSSLGTVAPSDNGRAAPYLTKHLNGVPLEQLFAMGEAVTGLVDDPGWAHVTALLDAEIAEIDRRLDTRQEPLTQAEYAMAHGRRSGLRGARDAMQAILHRHRIELERQRSRHEGDDGSSQEA